MRDRISRRTILGWGVAAAVLPGMKCIERSSSGGLLEFAEKPVAGTDSDFMIVRHLRLKGTNEAIGQRMALIAKTRHQTRLGKPKPEILEARRSWFKKHYPTHLARAEGVAREFAAGSELDNFELNYDLDFQPACSTVFYPPTSTKSGHATLSRNYDFSTGTYADVTRRPAQKGARPMTGDPYVIEVYPDKGIPTLYVCSYDLLGGCIDGMNAEGLSVALLANDVEQGSPTRGSRPGLGEIEITRFLLDQCRNLDEARTALEKATLYYSFIPCHYIVADRRGRSFVFEYTNDMQQRFFVEGKGGPQIVTNHPLHRFQGSEMPAESFEFGSFNRYRRLEREIAARGKMSVEAIKETNLCVAQRNTGSLPQSGPLGRTLWHSVYDLEDRTLDVDFYLGEDGVKSRRSGYRTFRLS